MAPETQRKVVALPLSTNSWNKVWLLSSEKKKKHPGLEKPALPSVEDDWELASWWWVKNIFPITSDFAYYYNNNYWIQCASLFESYYN